MGAEETERAFLQRKKRGESVRSATSPVRKVAVASDRPIMVRYWKCQPNESFMGVGFWLR